MKRALNLANYTASSSFTLQRNYGYTVGVVIRLRRGYEISVKNPCEEESLSLDSSCERHFLRSS